MSYAQARDWVAYQPFLPVGLRCEGEQKPVEEDWCWDGHVVHLDRHADDQAPVKLLALHGGGGNGRLLASFGIAARGIAETVAPDLPGYGHTRLASPSYTYEDWVACVEALVDAEVARDGRPVVLFGASMGGMLAYDVAARNPSVRGVIATCLLEPRDAQVRRAVVRHPALAPGIPILLALAPLLGGLRVPIRWLADVRAIANDPALAEACINDPVGGGNRVPLSFLASWLKSKRPVPPEHFATQVLLVHPGADRWTPAHLSRTFLDRVAGPTTYVELENCGHFPVEEPGITAMADAILAFLGQASEDDAAR
jgi:alpha-beta hydrolase superfamily lysophospholipase